MACVGRFPVDATNPKLSDRPADPPGGHRWPMTFETVSDWGLWFRNLILGAADLLREGWTPGIVSLVLMAAAILAAVLHWWRTWQRRRALRWAIRLVERAMDRASFVVELPRINRAFVQTRDSRRRWPGFLRPAEYRRPIAVAWGEYNETMVAPEQDQGGGGVMRNSLRPATFFDTEELGFGQGWWRILPGLFVSVGLLLTFLGLIAALTAIGGDEINDDSLRELLNAASAKFIMSLTGLACSIVLTVLFRIRADAIDRQGLICVGPITLAGRQKSLTGDMTHRVENARVADSPVQQVQPHHFLARRLHFVRHEDRKAPARVSNRSAGVPHCAGHENC